MREGLIFTRYPALLRRFEAISPSVSENVTAPPSQLFQLASSTVSQCDWCEGLALCRVIQGKTNNVLFSSYSSRVLGKFRSRVLTLMKAQGKPSGYCECGRSRAATARQCSPCGTIPLRWSGYCARFDDLDAP